MCNDFGNHIPYSDYLAAFSQTRIPVKWPDAIPNLQPRDDIWPTDRAPVIRRLAKRPADASQEASLLEDGTNKFAELRWGFPPAQPKRPPVINVRSEGRRFPVGRCLVPASHFWSLPARSPRRRSGSSQRSARIGSASPVYGVRSRRRGIVHAPDDRSERGCPA
jgi:putative SOS response-associated peptidase YedK